MIKRFFALFLMAMFLNVNFAFAVSEGQVFQEGYTGICWEDKQPYDSSILVLNVLDGSSAQNMGIRSGDKIIRIAGKPLKGLYTEDVNNLLAGSLSSSVSMTVKRSNTVKVFKVKRNLTLKEFKKLSGYYTVSPKVFKKYDYSLYKPVKGFYSVPKWSELTPIGKERPTLHVINFKHAKRNWLLFGSVVGIPALLVLATKDQVKKNKASRENYWALRKINFYKKMNACVETYRGNDLAACYSDIADKESVKVDEYRAMAMVQRASAERAADRANIFWTAAVVSTILDD